jgi:hypothetical protein
MTETGNIQRLPDGSIDRQHYERLGRALHGQALREAGHRAASAPERIVVGVFARFSGAWARLAYPSSRMSSKTL